MPTTDELREKISERTKASLRAAREAGVELGNFQKPEWKAKWAYKRSEWGLMGQRARKPYDPLENYADLIPVIINRRVRGRSWKRVARALNKMGHRTLRQNIRWRAKAVSALMKRYDSRHGTDYAKKLERKRAWPPN